MEQEVKKDVFEEGYDASRFTISVTVKKDNGDFLAKGRLTQSRAKKNEEGELDWEDRVVEGKVYDKESALASNTILGRLYDVFVDSNFNLFSKEADEEKNQDS